MDPLSAFSVACGVIQVVDFSTKVVVKCRELCKNGTLSENKEIESLAQHLTDLSTGLHVASGVPSPGPKPQLYQDDHDLRKLAQQCSETATELIAELQKLTIQGRRRKRDIVHKTVKVVWKKSTIEGIQRRLEQYRGTLDTRILINLRQHVHLIVNEQSDGFKDLDRKLQKLIIGVSRHQSTFDQLKDLIQAENESSKEYVSQQFKEHRELIAAEGSYMRLLESLYFPDIHARQEGIEEAHKQTFEWIFDRPGKEVRLWHHFIDWLENGHGTYWISGKAGSGKSTLMSFVCQDPRTEAALRVWSGTNETFMPTFFFWSPGAQLQKSLVGLLRSLIYQIMDRLPELMPVLASSLGLAHHRPQQLPTWTETRLLTTLRRLLSDGLEAYRLCVFVDGLDEFHGNQTALLDLIETLNETTRVKFCLSSRPYRSFEDALGSSAMLKLQDLTEPDIRRYISDKLDRTPLKALQIPSFPSRLTDTVDKMVKKAEGVFLWVALAVRDQLEGISNGDDYEKLQERLETLPEEIEGLYGHMLRGIDKVYYKEAAQYLQLVHHRHPWSLFDIALAVYNRVDDILLFSPDISIRDIHNRCILTGARITTTCKGFLEVLEDPNLDRCQKPVATPSGDVSPFLRTFVNSLQDQNILFKQHEALIETKFFSDHTRVNFLHRTAFDFFKYNEQGKEFLKTNASANPHPPVLYVKALLADLMLLQTSVDDGLVQRIINRIMRHACIAEDEMGVAQPALVDLLDRSLAMLYQRSRGQLTDFHWCKAWTDPRDYSDSLCSFNLEDSLTTPTTGPVDFLGFAASCGLRRYVEHSLESQFERRDPGMVEYLLSCTIDGLKLYYLYSSGNLKLISSLLKRGADPNMESFNGTAWVSFLQTLHKEWCWRTWAQDPYDSYEETWWGNSLQAFLESGSHVKERICGNVVQNFLEDVTHPPSSTPLRLTRFVIKLRLSALSVIQESFAGSPKFPEIMHSCVASGASLYTECTGVFFVIGDERDNSRYLYSKLSTQQLSQIADTWEDLIESHAIDRSKKRRMLNRQVAKLFQEIDIESLYEQDKQARFETLLQGRVMEGEESYEGESANEIESTSDASSISAQDSHTLEVEGPSPSAPTSEPHNQTNSKI